MNRSPEEFFARLNEFEVDFILSEVEGLGDYSKCLEVSSLFESEGVKFRILTRSALIKAKKAVGRPKDLHVVHELEAIDALSEE